MCPAEHVGGSRGRGGRWLSVTPSFLAKRAKQLRPAASAALRALARNLELAALDEPPVLLAEKLGTVLLQVDVVLDGHDAIGRQVQPGEVEGLVLLLVVGVSLDVVEADVHGVSPVCVPGYILPLYSRTGQGAKSAGTAACLPLPVPCACLVVTGRRQDGVVEDLRAEEEGIALVEIAVAESKALKSRKTSGFQ